MSATLVHIPHSVHAATDSNRRFACVLVALAVGTAALAGWAPIGVSIVTVFLFAGQHDW